MVPDDAFPPPRDFSPFWWVVLFTLLAMVGCVLASCRRAPVHPAAEAAPVVPHGDADECPGGVCLPPPVRKAPK